MTPIKYHDWVITYNPKPIPFRGHDYDLVHEDYDGPGDGRAYNGSSVEHCKQCIDEWEEDQ
jgi:hypothetical protein